MSVGRELNRCRDTESQGIEGASKILTYRLAARQGCRGFEQYSGPSEQVPVFTESDAFSVEKDLGA